MSIEMQVHWWYYKEVSCPLDCGILIVFMTAHTRTRMSAPNCSRRHDFGEGDPTILDACPHGSMERRHSRI